MKLTPVFALLLLLLACTDPITVGSDLLDEDRATVGEMDSIAFTTRVVREDSLLAFVGTTGSYQAPGAFSFGQLEDPTFGKTVHGVYLTPLLPYDQSSLPLIPPFASQRDAVVDSVVIILPIDTLRGFYGPGRTFPIVAEEIAASVTPLEDYYNDLELATEGMNVAADASFTASLEPQLVRDTSITSPGLERAHVRVRLTDAFAQRIDQLPASAYASDTTFSDNFAGIYLRPDGTSDALVTFTPSQNTNETAYSGINVYYRDSTGTPNFYRMAFLLALPSNQYDFGGSFVEPLLDAGEDNDIVALVGQSGLMTEINFPDVASLANRVINRAVLEIPVADVEGVDYTDFPLPTRVELFYRASADGPLINIADRVELLRSSSSLGSNISISNTLFFLGGELEEEGTLQYYSPAFSIHLQRIVDGEVPPRMYLRVSPLQAQEIRSARALLNGPAAAVNPARIRVTFTDLD